ncbi:MAG: ParB N-terminal domain-containing protein [Lachnospiraceae bacterium]|nr:ParB N-terminal domain-containing protein [Lachnospiraceae bacterium]MBP3458882.1 ParB N-terminal domain-containing protein [Lachnospiraceae bacterium]
MANKFNLETIKGGNGKKVESGQKQTISAETEKGKVLVGAGFFENAGKKHVGQEIIFIPRNKIDKNPNNFYSIDHIDSLAQSIRHSGLSQPLEVSKQENDRYILIGGERRLTAIDSLIADENESEWSDDVVIACVLKNPEEIDLPLSLEKKEDYAIITTNKEARTYTDGDTYMEIQKWKGIIQELRENGVEYIAGKDEDGKQQNVRIKGEKTRDIITKTVGISSGQVSKYEEVSNKGTQALKDALLNNKISVSVAAKAVHELDSEEQDALASDASQNTVTSKEIKKYKKDTGQNKEVITSAKFRKDIRNITQSLKEGEILLDETGRDKYYFYIRQLENILKSN